MVQVFPFQIDATAIFFRKSMCVIEGGRAPDIVMQKLLELFFEIIALDNFQIVVLEVLNTSIKYFGDVCSAKVSVKTVLIDLIIFHLRM